MLKYQKGDLFDHLQVGDIIAHCCNDVGAWGGGFTAALSKWSRFVEADFYGWVRGEKPELNPVYQLGEVLCTAIPNAFAATEKLHRIPYDPVKRPPYFYVVNMVGQHGLISSENPHPVSYPALEKAMRKVAKSIETCWWKADPPIPYRIVAPKFGAGLAGGDWNEIEKLINEVWAEHEVIIFELK
jgi:O-acetyl-ADP-ribose deacetylase (regulator of RNase III)